MGCIFFFGRSSERIFKWFADLFSGGGESNKYGWYNLTKTIAKTGVFGFKIREVEQSNLYEVLYFAMAEKVEAEKQ